jgi:phage I-like protein
MAVRLNDSGRSHAAELIAAGEIDKASPWSLTAEEENEWLGSDPDAPDWKTYASWHLGIKTGIERATKGAYVYPFGKGGKVYRSALIAIRQRASQQAAGAVFEAAGRLLQDIDGDAEVSAAASVASIGMCVGSEAAIEVAPWESLPEKVLQLLPYGTVRGQDQYGAMHAYVVNDRSLREIVERWAAREHQISFDYRHTTYKPSSEPLSGLASGWLWDLWVVHPSALETGENGSSPVLDALAAMWGSEARQAAEEWGAGVYGLVKLTARAAQLIADREFGYFSPVFSVDDETSEVLSIEGGALCNDPANGGLMPLAASDNPVTVTLAARPQPPDHQQGAATEPPAPTTRSKTMGKIDGVDSEALSGLTGKAITDPNQLVAAVGELASERQTVTSERDRLAAENAALRTRLANEEGARQALQMSTERAQREAAIHAAIDSAINDGRILASSRDSVLAVIDGDQTKADLFLASLPPARPAAPVAPAPGRITPPVGSQVRSASAAAGHGSSRIAWASDVAPMVRRDEQDALDAELASDNPDYRGSEGFKLACRSAAVRLGRS